MVITSKNHIKQHQFINRVGILKYFKEAVNN